MQRRICLAEVFAETSHREEEHEPELRQSFRGKNAKGDPFQNLIGAGGPGYQFINTFPTLTK